MEKRYTVNEYGEVIDNREQNELVTRKLMELGAIDEETYEELEMYQYYKERYETIRYVLEKAMREHGIKKWDNDYFIAICKDATVSTRVDTAKLKEDGLYDKYTKPVPVKESLEIKFKDQRKA